MPYPKFKPTEEQREDVEALSSAGVSQDAIAATIINPATNKPVKRDTLARIFKAELATAKTKLQREIMAQFMKKVREGHWGAIEFGLRYCLAVGNGNTTISIDGDPNSAMNRGITVNFVTPDPNRWKDNPMPGPYDPRPISKAEHYDAANVTHPHRIEHQPVNHQPVKSANKSTGWMK